MSTPISLSPILGCFVRAAKRDFPEAQSAKIADHQADIDQTTSESDHHRARRCALWAIEMADEKDRTHPHWKQIKELQEVWKDTWFGLDFGAADALPGTQHGGVGKPEPSKTSGSNGRRTQWRSPRQSARRPGGSTLRGKHAWSN
jgi:hypothetical protein